MNSGFVNLNRSQPRKSAAWFEVKIEDKTVVIYNVHLPTPRPEFKRLLEFLKAKDKNWLETSSTYRKAVTVRIETARSLARVLSQENRTTLVVGDLNVPDHGYLYHLFSSGFKDVFKTEGKWYGWTFPGSLYNPLDLVGPWLRLDYIFCGSGVIPRDFRTIPLKNSEHFPIIGKIDIYSSE